jgi:hypothetical protein
MKVKKEKSSSILLHFRYLLQLRIQSGNFIFSKTQKLKKILETFAGKKSSFD